MEMGCGVYGAGVGEYGKTREDWVSCQRYLGRGMRLYRGIFARGEREREMGWPRYTYTQVVGLRLIYFFALWQGIYGRDCKYAESARDLSYAAPAS